MNILKTNRLLCLLALGALLLSCKGESGPEIGLRFAEGTDALEIDAEGGSSISYR